MSNDSPTIPILPPKLPGSKIPPLPPGSRNTMNGKQIPTTAPPIPPRNPSQDNVTIISSNGNGNGIQQSTSPSTTSNHSTSLITHKKTHNSLSPNSTSPINSPMQPQSPQTQLSPSHSPRPVSPPPPKTPPTIPAIPSRPLPTPKENSSTNVITSNLVNTPNNHSNNHTQPPTTTTTTTNTERNSFQQVLHAHPLSNQYQGNGSSSNNVTQQQHNTLPHPNKPPARKLPPPPVPPTRNTVNLSHSELPTTNTLTRQPPPLPPSFTPPIKKINSSNDPELFASPTNNDNQVLNQSNNIISIVNASYPSLEHFNQFTSTRDLKVKEVLITERTYVDNMKILVEVFIDPLKAGDGGISRDHAIIICSNLADILMISIELLKGLEKKIAEWSDQQTIGDVFNALIPFLRMYTNYTVGYDNVMNIVSECEKNSSFKEFTQKCSEDQRTKKLDLRSYLIQPVQRITRYHMLLEEVLKHTPNTHPDFEDLQKSYLEMKKVTFDANEAIKKSENRAKVFEIQKMFMKDPEIVAAHREYIFDGVLTKVCRKASKKRYVFLFSDLLVYGSSIPPKLLLHEKLELVHCRIEDIPDGSNPALTNNGSPILNAFQIHSNKKSFVVFADNQDMKMKWMIHLAETIDTLLLKRKTIKSETITRSEAPVWVPDESNPNCTQCNNSFSFYNRRHHCRKCGALVCSDCSSNKFKLPISDFKPVRVCNKCFLELNQNQSTQKLED